jgi:hypothetical protein
MSRAILSGALYFAVVFAAGFALGTIRVLWLAPRIGERAAELAETPVMVALCWFAARGVVGRLSPRPSGAERAIIGAVGLALLLALEFGVVRSLRGLTIDEALGGRDPVAFAAYLVALVVFAALPFFVRRDRPADSPLPHRRSTSP